MELLANFLVFALCYAGLSSLCLAMDRHYADLHGRGAEPPAPLRRRLQWGAGWRWRQDWPGPCISPAEAMASSTGSAA